MQDSRNAELRRAVGGLFRKARLKAGLHQVELADQLGVPQSWISNVEQGVRRIDIVEAWELSDALGVDLEDIRDHAQRSVGEHN